MAGYRHRPGKRKLRNPKTLSAKGLQEEINYRQGRIDDLIAREREAREREGRASRNRQFVSTSEEKIAKCRSKIKTLKTNPINYTHPIMGRVNMLVGTLKQEARGEIEHLEQSIKTEKAYIDSLKDSLYASPLNIESDLKYHRQRIAACTQEQEARKLKTDQLEARIETRKEQQRLKAQKTKQKIENLKALAAISVDQRRELAYAIKKKLDITKDCPYCGGPLGIGWHADHIYPVSRGGQSTAKNMVIVCASCNIKKAGLTLLLFIERHKLNREEVERRLKELGKEF